MRPSTENCKLALVVDDSAVHRHELARLLRSIGLETIEAVNGLQAYSSARVARPDIIFMDVDMPLLDGHKATRRLFNDPATTHIPVIVVSTERPMGLQLRAIMHGAVDILGKPTALADLKACLAQHLPGDSRCNEAAAIGGPDAVPDPSQATQSQGTKD